ncbi:NADH-quinone oxidoreductase subunit NuoE [Ruania suaedae]|uniref:NADH-quinone oxidoreductase subunit NuoE n=1 Tax=Ruania suaedae TaxID=2897774 RepID=UPI001E60A856|nr:NADH-quinone oxidoreductase subunit NuoE [Ruania suaedae]UFU02477.1 NADH-quinone oxidoreductase subunit NuoE [Ruania suaedae]
MATSMTSYPADVADRLGRDAQEILGRYPQPRSALLPLLHLVQSEDGYVSPAGIGFCADVLGLSRASVSAVATFYSQYKRHPNGTYTVGVCTNTLCAVMGGDAIFDHLSATLGIGHDETTEDGTITLERVECNAACDYAPVMVINWEFFDNQTPTSAAETVGKLLAGEPVTPTRGADRVATFKEVSRVLAGFEDGHADEGLGAGSATLVGLELARRNNWRAPGTDEAEEAAGPQVAAEAAALGHDPVGDEGSSAEREPRTPGDADADPVKSTDEEGTNS